MDSSTQSRLANGIRQSASVPRKGSEKPRTDAGTLYGSGFPYCWYGTSCPQATRCDRATRAIERQQKTIPCKIPASLTLQSVLSAILVTPLLDVSMTDACVTTRTTRSRLAGYF